METYRSTSAAKVAIPVIGGHAGATIMPVFSQDPFARLVVSSKMCHYRDPHSWPCLLASLRSILREALAEISLLKVHNVVQTDGALQRWHFL